MPFDLRTFKTRSLTAVIFTIIMLAGLLINIWTFMILILIIHFGCWQEYVRLIKIISPERNLWLLLLGVAYITLPIIMIADLRLTYISGAVSNEQMLKIIPCAIIFSIWINDTMAYIVGSFIGKNPLSKISPKKTWEGTVGGGILCVIAISFAGYLTHWFSLIDWIAISGICAFFGTLGDLLESKIKRTAGVKDSGSFMPGHGGFLDRFDSFLIATPFVWLFVQFFMK